MTEATAQQINQAKMQKGERRCVPPDPFRAHLPVGRLFKPFEITIAIIKSAGRWLERLEKPSYGEALRSNGRVAGPTFEK